MEQRLVVDPIVRKKHMVRLDMGSAILVDDMGHIEGSLAEGTLGIILQGGHPSFCDEKGFDVAYAVRLPRLLQSDLLLNFHVAHISYHEGRQALRFAQKEGVLGASSFFRLEEANGFTTIPETGEGPCYIGFYLSPMQDYKICLVSPQRAWPADFDKVVDAPKLFKTLQKHCETSRKGKEFGDMLFVPDKEIHTGQQASGVINPVTGERFDLSVDKNVAGWWFNLPLAIYPWMSSNLERQLTGMLEAEEQTSSRESLRGWDTYSWLMLIKQLVLGLSEIHRHNAIHGDLRPANIMADIPVGGALKPESFRLIDVGLGFGSASSYTHGSIPRPLGGNRSSVFYAPERNEGNEFEDADVAHLRTLGDGTMKLELHWKARTNLEPSLMMLKDETTALKALGELSEGDRVQVREFVFDVVEVEPDGLIVSHVYELKLDRVLIEKTGEELELVKHRLRHAPISRYKIYYEWSQASDLYSLGVIVLYFFYVRGIYKGMINKEAFEFSGREMIFEELVGVLRNRGFLDIFLQGLDTSQFRGPGQILDPALHEKKGSGVDDIVGILSVADINFLYVLRGLDEDCTLFVQVIYFVLCCLWRQREAKDIILKSNFAFEPFANDRQFDGVSPAHAAEQALAFVEDMIKIYGNHTYRESKEGKKITEELGKTQMVQMMGMKKELEETRKRLEKNGVKLAGVAGELGRALKLVEAPQTGWKKFLGNKGQVQLQKLLKSIKDQVEQ